MREMAACGVGNTPAAGGEEVYRAINWIQY